MRSRDRNQFTMSSGVQTEAAWQGLCIGWKQRKNLVSFGLVIVLNHPVRTGEKDTEFYLMVEDARTSFRTSNVLRAA